MVAKDPVQKLLSTAIYIFPPPGGWTRKDREAMRERERQTVLRLQQAVAERDALAEDKKRRAEEPQVYV